MPPRPAGETKHTRRIDAVRPRLVSVLRQIPDKSGITAYGQFAHTCAEIAKRDNRKWFGTKRKAGAPLPVKDTTSSIRRFAEGKQGMSFERLDVVELACIEWEAKFRADKVERAQSASHLDYSPEELVRRTPPPLSAPSSPPRPLWSDDPEIDAMSKVKDALDPLDESARARVLEYMAKRYAVTNARG